eukprot:CAMPEP_0170554370 /NCGR_PEP_ID=MMETSP0211-20121228/12207_1 /TAXON_ID=311385 /ORGANISM="Pseudokeronopsis sp., Strain OXSARD2" /LENGTH=50 /DNA_ID=CAMNT_0010863351 /DNA_START=232 /DNA_END=384 /DNA_ORIENTATION=+
MDQQQSSQMGPEMQMQKYDQYYDEEGEDNNEEDEDGEPEKFYDQYGNEIP